MGNRTFVVRPLKKSSIFSRSGKKVQQMCCILECSRSTSPNCRNVCNKKYQKKIALTIMGKKLLCH